MKIECPSCQANYEVADHAIGEKGRNLRCAACGHYWFQKPANMADAVKVETANPQLKVTQEKQLKGENKKAGFGNIFAKKPSPQGAPHQQLRKKVHDKIKLSHIGAIAAGWIGAIAILGAIIGTMVVNRVDIVKKWPKSASFFASLGVPVNLYGLEIKKIEIRSGIDEQGPRIMVLGLVKNVSNAPKALPYLRITLMEGSKKSATWLVDPSATMIDKGQEISFQSIRRNPPHGNLKAIVVFADDPKELSAKDMVAKVEHGPENSLLLGTTPSAAHENAHETPDAQASAQSHEAPSANHDAPPAHAPAHAANNEAPASHAPSHEPSHEGAHTAVGR